MEWPSGSTWGTIKSSQRSVAAPCGSAWVRPHSCAAYPSAPTSRCEAESDPAALSSDLGASRPGPRTRSSGVRSVQNQAQTRAQDAVQAALNPDLWAAARKDLSKRPRRPDRPTGGCWLLTPPPAVRPTGTPGYRGGPSKGCWVRHYLTLRPRGGPDATSTLGSGPTSGGQHAASIGTRDPVLYLAKRSSRSASPHPLATWRRTLSVSRRRCAIRSARWVITSTSAPRTGCRRMTGTFRIRSASQRVIGWIEARATEWSIDDERRPFQSLMPLPRWQQRPIARGGSLTRGRKPRRIAPRLNRPCRGRRRVARAGDGGIRSAPDDPGLGAARCPCRDDVDWDTQIGGLDGDPRIRLVQRNSGDRVSALVVGLAKPRATQWRGSRPAIDGTNAVSSASSPHSPAPVLMRPRPGRAAIGQ